MMLDVKKLIWRSTRCKYFHNFSIFTRSNTRAIFHRCFIYRVSIMKKIFCILSTFILTVLVVEGADAASLCQRKNRVRVKNANTRVQALRVIQTGACPHGFAKVAELTSFSDVQSLIDSSISSLQVQQSLKGEKGDKGDKGDIGLAGADGSPTVQTGVITIQDRTTSSTTQVKDLGLYTRCSLLTLRVIADGRESDAVGGVFPEGVGLDVESFKRPLGLDREDKISFGSVGVDANGQRRWFLVSGCNDTVGCATQATVLCED